jgi:3-deoxy-7-phosphoheptulonate synthase
VEGTPAILHTDGNRDCHVILRGGRAAPNYDAGAVAMTLEQLRAAELPERLVIDASHDNSGKDHLRQGDVVREVADQVGEGNGAIVGVMLESFLVAGRQELDPEREMVYGQSITDACMDWDATVLALDRLAASVQERRARG